MLTELYLIRHCQAEGQSPESRLTEKGQQDALKLAEFLKDYPIDAIFSSPFLRALETVQPFSDTFGIPIHTDMRFKERRLSSNDFPDWLERLKITFQDFDIIYDGGESSNEAMARAICAVNEILSTHIKRVAIVTHGNLLSLMLHNFDKTYGFDVWKSLTNPDVFLLTFKSDKVKIKRLWA